MIAISAEPPATGAVKGASAETPRCVPDKLGRYRITVTPYQAGFSLSAGLDRFDVPQTSAIPVQLLLSRRDYAGPVEVSVVGDHPGIAQLGRQGHRETAGVSCGQ